MHRYQISAMVGWLLFAAVPVIAAPPPTFEKDIRPILKAHCFDCHGEGEKLNGGLDLRLRRLMLKGGDDGPVIVPGKPERSLLFKLVHSGEDSDALSVQHNFTEELQRLLSETQGWRRRRFPFGLGCRYDESCEVG